MLNSFFDFSDEVLDEIADPDHIIMVPQWKIGRTRKSELYSEESNKCYRPVYNKGRVLSNFAFPFGALFENE